ncbi:uncharacterized mitochondrial protein-like protein [Tanacetum coccineum]
MCDKKNSVLFNDTECIVLSLNFKLTDESHVLLKVPRKNNMYSVDLKNIVPKGGLTCLFAKATSDESKLWHRRLGHINLKTMNKLVKGNLVRGLPSKLFENDQTCVACQKGKQHRASCKSKTLSSICQPLHMLHMDLFGPTFVKSLMKKIYYLVVTDDYSRFSWVFFLATKDETSGILKSFITGVENLIDQRVKEYQSNNNGKYKACDDAGDDEKKVTEEPGTKGGDLSKDGKSYDQEKEDNVNSNNTVNAASTNEVNVVGAKTSIELLDDPNMHELEDIVYSDDDEDVGQRTDMNNLDDILCIKEQTIKTFKFACFLSQEEPKKVLYALKDQAGLEAMHMSFYQLKITEVWTLTRPLLSKGDKGDILLVQVYVDDIIFCSTKKSLCTEFEKMMHKKFKMSSMGELTFFLGLQVKQKGDGIFISQDKYVTEILKKFGFTDVKTASTPMETQKLLLKDEDGEEVDVYLNRSVIGSLMYLTSSRPDIMFAVCACARYQLNPKVLHLHVVKKIFRYLKGQIKLGLWYPKDSLFDLVAYADSDYARESLDRKSTTGEKEDNVNSTNTVNAASTNEVNVVGAKTSIKLPDDPNMPELEDIVYSNDDEDVGAKADMNNLDEFISVSPIPTIRVHKDHPVKQIIRDLNLEPQTRRNDNGFGGNMVCLVQFSKEQTIKTFKIACLLAFYHKKNPKRYTHKRTGFDYDEVFSPVARIEAIRLFLAYASFKDFVVYQMDVKSAFLYGKIEKEVYVCQPPGFEDPDFPDRVYKVEKALYGLHQSSQSLVETFQDKYVTEILPKFGFTDVKTASTPMETQKLLLKDKYCKKQTVVANPLQKCKYVAASSCLWTSALDLEIGIGVNAGDSKLMLLGINLLLLGKVNVARHKLTAARESINLLLLGKVNAARHKLTTAVES